MSAPPEHKEAIRAAVGGGSLPLDRLLDALAGTNASLVPGLVDESSTNEAAFLPLFVRFRRAKDDQARAETLRAMTDIIAQGIVTEEVVSFLWEILNAETASPTLMTVAGRALAVAGDEEFIDITRRMLEIGDLTDMPITVRMVGYARDEACLPALIRYLNPHNCAFADLLIWAMGEIGSAEAIPVLHAVMESHLFVSEVIEALGKIGHEASLQLVLPVLVTHETEERELAAEAVVRIIRNAGGQLSPELLDRTKAILEKSMDQDESKTVRYFCMVAHGLLGGDLQVNRVLTALGAAMQKDEMSPMSAFFVGRSKAPQHS